MAKARSIALAFVFVAVVAAIVASRLASSRSTDNPPPAGVGQRPLTEAGASGGYGMLGTDEVVDFWRIRVERNPQDYISAAELGATFIRRARVTGDVDSYSRAETALQRALAVNPSYSTALGYLASVRYAQHNFREALKIAQRIFVLDPGAVQSLAVIGDARLELGDYRGAAEAYERLLELSKTPPVYSRLARLRELQGRPQEAILLLNQAIDETGSGDATPETQAFYHLQLGHTYFNIGDLDSAEDQYQRSVDVFPGYVHGLAGLARVRAARGDYDAAVSLYKDVVARYPLAEYVVALGDAYRVAGRADDASKQFALVGAIDRLYKANGINTDLQMAQYRADHDPRGDEALRQARAAYAERPSIYAADTLAWALYKSGEYEGAQRYSREALRLGTRDALLLFHAGMIARELGDAGEARSLLSRALDINPYFSLLHAGEAERALAERPNPRPLP